MLIPQLQDGAIPMTIDLRVYRLEAIQKAAYRIADRSTVIIGTTDGDHLPVAFTFRPSTSERDAKEVVRLFFEEVLDQELREKIGEETRPMRSLLLAHAFSRTDLIKRDGM